MNEFCHRVVKATYKAECKDYSNITRAVVDLFKKGSTSCELSLKNTTTPKLNPIISNEFMERFQIDLIDMRSSPNIQNMTFTFHDMCHFTKFHILKVIIYYIKIMSKILLT